MINYEKYTLENGLNVILNHDPHTPLVHVNLLYRVGAKHENPERTGFAHLFEHLMFSGSKHVPDYDKVVQEVGGENNAFTNNDFTNYYISLPAENIETALWVESDRMMHLNINQQSLKVQQGVVIEEFKQRYLNQPYGDVWLLLRPLAYTTHPYQWATIGKDIRHIEDARLEDVHDFYDRFYQPGRAILSISGNFQPSQIKAQVEKWFADIPGKSTETSSYLPEPIQEVERIHTVHRKVDYDAIYMAFHMCERKNPLFYQFDLLSDILSTGKSSRLYQELIQKQRLFSELNAWITGDEDPGLFIISGILMKGVSPEKAKEAIWKELERLHTAPPTEAELAKVKTKLESNTRFGETSALNRAMSLGYFEMLGDIELINTDLNHYQSITSANLLATAKRYFVPGNLSTLYYLAD